MAKLHRATKDLVMFHCPGCECSHGVRVTGPHAWEWNGSVESPTFRPSILVQPGGCHSYVTDGQIQFLGDSEHELAGQTVPLPEWDE